MKRNRIILYWISDHDMIKIHRSVKSWTGKQNSHTTQQILNCFEQYICIVFLIRFCRHERREECERRFAPSHQSLACSFLIVHPDQITHFSSTIWLLKLAPGDNQPISRFSQRTARFLFITHMESRKSILQQNLTIFQWGLCIFQFRNFFENENFEHLKSLDQIFDKNLFLCSLGRGI